MSISCPTPDRASAKPAMFTVALAGNPNSGKTTIFNALTGLRQKVGNYPGVTIEKKTGRSKLPDGSWIDVIDLPGTYSLVSRSPDEVVAMEVLRGLRKDTPAPDAVIVVVDASNLQRNLYLVSQLIELGRPMVVALNMMDVAERRGLTVSSAKLAQQLGVPVVAVVGHKGRGILELKAAISRAVVAPMPDWPLPAAMKEQVVALGGHLSAHAAPGGSDTVRPPLEHYQVLAERLLVGDRSHELGAIAKQAPLNAAIASAESRLTQLGIDPMQADIEAHYHWIDRVAAAATEPTLRVLETPSSRKPANGDGAALDYASPKRTFTQSLDRVLVHKVWGLLIFAAIMATLFVSIFWLADPVMGACEEAVGYVGGLVTDLLPDGPVRDLWTDGIVAGVGGVVVFVPQIAMLFLFLAVMEDSGYLARAAFLMDRVLAKVGLHGKSFIPLLSSFACAIPGIMATRTIENRKDRLATILVAPFMSCSARLPVYTLLIGSFFASLSPLGRGGIMLTLYALGIVAAALTAWAFKGSFLKGPKPAFILEMPTYKLPQASQVARQVWTNTSAFLKKAGTIIFCLSVLIWAITYYPRLPEAEATAVSEKAAVVAAAEIAKDGATDANEYIAAASDKAVAGEQLRYSLAGRFGHLIEPALKPLGYDWKMGVGLVGAFAAREVFVSTMGIVYSVGDAEEDTVPLEDAMRADTYADGAKVWNPAVALSLLVWFVLAMQCMSTLAIVRRETGGWGWPLFMMAYMNGIAYLAAFAIYQIGSRLLA